MADRKVWLITGAGRGMGVDIHGQRSPPATPSSARLRRRCRRAVRPSRRRGDNAGSFNAGFFEEITAADSRAQIETTLFGPINVARAALPQMRAQRLGLLVTISSTAGIAGQAFFTAYAASKFAIEGWMESLAPEVEPFGIRTMLVEPGFFRTELLSPQLTASPRPPSTTMPSAPRRRSRHGKPWTAAKAVTPPSSPTYS